MENRRIQELSKSLGDTIVETQFDIENTTYYGKSSDNKVKVAVKGSFDLDDVKINPELLDPKYKEVLENNIIEAVTLAMRSSRLDSQSRLLELMKDFDFRGF